MDLSRDTQVYFGRACLYESVLVPVRHSLRETDGSAGTGVAKLWVNEVYEMGRVVWKQLPVKLPAIESEHKQL